MSLIGHWVAADIVGSTLPDRSASNADGTLSGAVARKFKGESVVWCPSNGGVSIPDAAAWTLGDFTIIARLVFHYTGGNPAWLSHSEGAGFGAKKWVVYYGGGKTALHYETANITVDGNSWTPSRKQIYALGLKRSGSNFTFYRDGATDGTASDAAAFSDAAAPLLIGNGAEGTYDSWVSVVALRIYDAALVDADVFAAMDDDNPNVTVPSGLVGYWRGYEGTDTLGTIVLPDLSGQGNDAECSPSSGSTLEDVDGQCACHVPCSQRGDVDPVDIALYAPDALTIVARVAFMGGNDDSDFSCNPSGAGTSGNFGAYQGIAAYSQGGHPLIAPSVKWVFYYDSTLNKLGLLMGDGTGGGGFGAGSAIFSSVLPITPVVGEMYSAGVRFGPASTIATFFWEGAPIGTATTPLDLLTPPSTSLPPSAQSVPLLAFGDGGEVYGASNVAIAALRFWNYQRSNSEIAAAMAEDADIPECGEPFPSDCDDDLDDEDLISFKWDAGDAGLVNRVVWEYDYDALADTFQKMVIFSHDESIRKYGPRPELQFRSKGLKSSLGADAFVEERAREIFARFGDAPPAVVQIEAFYRKGIAWEPGDIICLTSAFIPNLLRGERGLDEEKFELVDYRPQFGARGRLIGTLIDIEALTDQPTGSFSGPVSVIEPTATYEPLTELSLMGVGISTEA